MKIQVQPRKNEIERHGELDPLIPGMLRGPAAQQGL